VYASACAAVVCDRTFAYCNIIEWAVMLHVEFMYWGIQLVFSAFSTVIKLKSLF